MPIHRLEARAWTLTLEPFEAFTGDRNSAVRLRANLTRIADDHAGSSVASIANAVLAGRCSIRDLADDPAFSELIADGVDDYRRYLDSLTPADRTEMIDTAVKIAQHPE